MKIRGACFVVSTAVVFQIGVGCSSSSDSGSTVNPVDSGVPDSAIVEVDSGPNVGCPKPTGGPTTHTANVGTEAWTAETSPHIVPNDLNVTGALTIDPCAEVLLAKGVTLTVTATGSIAANGTAAQPVHIGAQDPANPFIMIRTSPGGTIHLAYTTVDGGGDPSNIIKDTTGILNLQGADQTKPSQETLFVDHVELKGSKTNGLVLRDGAGFATGSQNLTIDGSALFPLSIWARALDRIPTGTYTGNGTDEILVVGGAGDAAVAESETMHDRGVPYRIGDSQTDGILDIDPLPAAAASTLTIEAGVTVKFKKAGVFHINTAVGTSAATAALIAVGTAAKPITFTSAEAAPAAGDWLGIYFGMQPLATNKLDFVKVQYAGGLSAVGSDSCPYPAGSRSDAAIRIFGVAPSAFVTNTTISDSAYFGIDRGWRNDSVVDFLPTNTFTNVPNCQESYPKATAGTCPATVPCPM